MQNVVWLENTTPIDARKWLNVKFAIILRVGLIVVIIVGGVKRWCVINVHGNELSRVSIISNSIDLPFIICGFL